MAHTPHTPQSLVVICTGCKAKHYNSGKLCNRCKDILTRRNKARAMNRRDARELETLLTEAKPKTAADMMIDLLNKK